MERIIYESAVRLENVFRRSSDVADIEDAKPYFLRHITANASSLLPAGGGMFRRCCKILDRLINPKVSTEEENMRVTHAHRYTGYTVK